MLPEIIVDTERNLPRAFAARVVHQAQQSIAARGRFAIALSGGSVAHTFFPELAATAFDWSLADFFWCDERAVPPTDPESNYGLAKRLWLDAARVPAERLHRMEGDTGDLAAAADAYSEMLTARLGTPPRLDVALIGVGEDGHVCSLFPDHPLLMEERRWAAAVLDAPKPPPHRLTLTLPTLAAAELIVIAAFGHSKAAVVGAALDDSEPSLPLSMVLRRARRTLVLLDHAAAARPLPID